MIGNAKRALAESAMWSVVGVGSVRRASEELATSLNPGGQWSAAANRTRSPS
jgi:hypothetical protein